MSRMKKNEQDITRFSPDMTDYMLDRLPKYPDAYSLCKKAESNKKKETAWTALTDEINLRFSALLKRTVQLKVSTVQSKFAVMKSETRTALVEWRKGENVFKQTGINPAPALTEMQKKVKGLFTESDLLYGARNGLESDVDGNLTVTHATGDEGMAQHETELVQDPEENEFDPECSIFNDSEESTYASPVPKKVRRIQPALPRIKKSTLEEKQMEAIEGEIALNKDHHELVKIQLEMAQIERRQMLMDQKEKSLNERGKLLDEREKKLDERSKQLDGRGKKLEEMGKLLEEGEI